MYLTEKGTWKIPSAFYNVRGSVLIYVAMNAHFGDVEAGDLGFSWNPDGGDLIGDLEKEVHDGEYPDEAGDGSDELGQELAGVAIEETFNGSCYTVPAISIRSVGEQAEGQYAPGAVSAVYGKAPTGSSILSLRSSKL